jgi:hypothetical protein
MTFICRSILLCALAFFSWAPAFAQTTAAGAPPASMVVGAIKAANVRGTVKKVNLIDKTETVLRNGEVLIQDNAVVTGPGDSSVVLVFANGSTVKVGNESRLEIKEFLMDPLQADVPSVAALTSEPTVSRTNLRLEFGEMVGNVKTLNRAAGSTFSVSTPAGAAGIRGTIFRIVYRPTGNGQAFNYQLSTSEGLVLFEGTTAGGLAAVNVPLGQEIMVVATINPATNSIVISMPAAIGGTTLVTVPISPAAAAALQTVTLQIIQSQQQTSFTQIDFQTARQQHQQQQQNQPPGQGQGRIKARQTRRGRRITSTRRIRVRPRLRRRFHRGRRRVTGVERRRSVTTRRDGRASVMEANELSFGFAALTLALRAETLPGQV